MMTKSSLYLAIFLPFSMIALACTSNQSNSTDNPNNDSVGIHRADSLNIPDSIRKASVLTDTSWSQAVKTLSNDNPADKKSLTKTATQPDKEGAGVLKADETKAATPKGKIIPVTMNPFRPQELLDGLKKAQDGNLKGAIVDFTAALKKNPKNYNAYFYRAKARIETGDNEGALDDLNNAIENKGDEAIYFYYRGKMFSDAGESQKAVMDFNKSIQLKHNFTDALNYRGVEKAKQGFHNEAIKDYDSAILSNPGYALCYYNKGTSQATLGDFKSAKESFTKAINLSPKYTLSYLNRGNCSVQLKDYPSAIADFTKAIELEPKNTDAYYNRGAAHYLAGDKQMCPDWKKAASMGNAKAKGMIEKYCK
jgi:tetratricopeptide (TPR) repeat protein